MPQKTPSGFGDPLRFLNLENRYVRVARFYPALVTIALLLPAAVSLGIALNGWVMAMSAGAGAVVLAAAVVLISHLASAAGNRLQKHLFPNWPYDSPTNARLLPSGASCSNQQKEKWYGSIYRLTGIDIAAVAHDEDEVKRAINDALVILRTKVFHENKLASRLDMHNADYGFARNFAGLQPAWLLTSLFSCAICWWCYAARQDHLALPIVSSLLFVGCVLTMFVIVDYVRQVSRHYADSFFGTLESCDKASRSKRSEGSSRSNPNPAGNREAVNAADCHESESQSLDA